MSAVPTASEELQTLKCEFVAFEGDKMDEDDIFIESSRLLQLTSEDSDEALKRNTGNVLGYFNMFGFILKIY